MSRTASRIRVFLVDDHAVFRDGLKLLVSSRPDMEVVGEASTAREALTGISNVKPDIAVIDLGLRDREGVELVRMAKATHAALRVMILSMYDDDFRVGEAFEAGADGYVVKRSDSSEVIEGIASVARGETVVSQAVAGAMVRMIHDSTHHAGTPMESLSPRERQVLRLLAQGLSTREAAAHLSISPKTVETHRARVGMKLGCRRLADLVRIAVRSGLVEA